MQVTQYLVQLEARDQQERFCKIAMLVQHCFELQLQLIAAQKEGGA